MCYCGEAFKDVSMGDEPWSVKIIGSFVENNVVTSSEVCDFPLSEAS